MDAFLADVEKFPIPQARVTFGERNLMPRREIGLETAWLSETFLFGVHEVREEENGNSH
jgi:hypothetical protein